MLDILESTILLGLYVLLPMALLTRHFGVQKAVLTLAAIFTFFTFVPSPRLEENTVNFIPNNTDLTTVILASSQGDSGKGRPHKFVNPNPDYTDGHPSRSTDNTGGRRYNHNPQYRSDPNSNGKNIPGLASGRLDENEVPKESEWETDASFWDDTGGDTCEQEDELEGGLPVKVDFDYQLDENGNPTLFVPNIDSTRKTMKGRNFNQVEFDQAASHVHHFPDHGIPLPADFDLVAYKNMKKADRVVYAKQKIPFADIVSYQNKLGKSMSLIFGQNTVPIRGFAGERKVNAGLVFQQIPGRVDLMMTIIKDNGKHVSSYPITPDQFNKIKDNDFWVLKNRPFN